MVFAILALLFVVGVAAVLRDELERKAGSAYVEFKERIVEYERKIDEANREIEIQLNSFSNAIGFHNMCEIHYRSHLIAQEAYRALEDARLIRTEFQKTYIQAIAEKKKINEKKKIHYNNGDHEKIPQLKEEVNNIHIFLNGLHDQQVVIQSEVNNFKSKVDYLNKRTHDLKIQIRDSSTKGLDWFNRLEQRKRERR